jgi:translation initiation factor 2 alpha subunit (eIF-2alpha)
MEEGDLILCTVKEIERTAVFVELPNKEKGTIVISEIAAGRIKNMREYVVPNKKIVCKVLRLSNGNVELSLRRVSSKEQKEVMDKFKQEQTSMSALKSILKENYEEVNEKILKDYPSIFDFLSSAREKEEIITKYIPSEVQSQIKKLTEKKKKFVEVKKLLKIKCLLPDGIKKIKEILNIKDEEVKTTYIAAGEFQLTFKGEDYKTLNKKIQTILEEIEKQAKSCSCEFSIEEKK